MMLISANRARQFDRVSDRKSQNSFRRLAKLQRRGLFAPDTTGALFERAVTVDDLKNAYTLVHDCFVNCGYIKSRPSGMRIRAYETSADTATFIAKLGHQTVGALSLITDSPDLGLPSEQTFPDEINRLRRPGIYLAEVDSLALSPKYRNTAIATELMRCMYAHAVAVGCTDLICSVSRWAIPIFSSMGFAQIGNERNYGAAEGLDDPVRLLSLSALPTRWRTAPQGEDPIQSFWYEYLRQNNPYFQQIAQWRILSATLFCNPQAIAPLFAECPELFLHATENQLIAMEQRLDAAFELAAPNEIAKKRMDRLPTQNDATRDPLSKQKEGFFHRHAQMFSYAPQALSISHPLTLVEHLS